MIAVVRKENTTLEILVVSPVDPLGAGFLNRMDLQRFATLKGQILGYVEATLNSTVRDNVVNTRLAPLGAVENGRDASTLLDALTTAFPGLEFRTESFQFVRRGQRGQRRS